MPECTVCGLVTTSSPCSACGSETVLEIPDKSDIAENIGTSEEGKLPFGLEGESGQSTISSIPFGLDLSPIMNEKMKLAFGFEESPKDAAIADENAANYEPSGEEISNPLLFDLSSSPDEQV